MTKEQFIELYGNDYKLIAVHCKTEELANEFLQLADSFGFKWASGKDLTSSNGWKTYKENTCYELTIKPGVTYAKLEYFKEIGFEIVEFKGKSIQKRGMNKMELKDLKAGMLGKLRNGNGLVIVEDDGFGVEYSSEYGVVGIIELNEYYNEDLTNKYNNLKDIVKLWYGDKVVFERNESRWFVPKYDEEYFGIDSYGEISSTNNMQVSSDTKILNNNRVFKTQEEAEKRLRQQQATLSVERWIADNDIEVDMNDEDIIKCFIYYDIETKEFKIGYSYHRAMLPKQFILSSEEKAEQLIEEHEKELKIMFDVE